MGDQYIRAGLEEPRAFVEQYRANAAALRRLYRCRAHGATLRAIADREAAQDLAQRRARTSAQRGLAGALADEAQTVIRVRAAAELEQRRPELERRLANARRAIRLLVADVEREAAVHTVEPVWASGGPGRSAFSDYRWECGCGRRYGNATLAEGDVSEQHAAHLAAVAEEVAV